MRALASELVQAGCLQRATHLAFKPTAFLFSFRFQISQNEELAVREETRHTTANLISTSVARFACPHKTRIGAKCGNSCLLRSDYAVPPLRLLTSSANTRILKDNPGFFSQAQKHCPPLRFFHRRKGVPECSPALENRAGHTGKCWPLSQVLR
jgi:hypothetical protein